MENTNNQNVSKNREGLVNLFRRASRLMARTYHRRDHAHHAQARVLSIIREKGSINQRDLLEILDVRSSSLSEVLGKLERSGQIVRKKNEEDKRSFIISVTDKAQTPGDGPADISKKEAEGLFDCLDDQEREQLGSILEKIVKTLKEDSLSQDFEDKDRWHRRGGRGQGHGRGKSHGFNPAERGGRAFQGHGKFSAGSRSKNGS